MDYPTSSSSQISTNAQSTTHVGNNNEQNKGFIADRVDHCVVDNSIVNNNCCHFTKCGEERAEAAKPNATPAIDDLDALFGNNVSLDGSHHFFHPEYHPETRLEVLEAMEDWIDMATGGPAESPILWLYGPPGVGKSVTAKTICDRPRQVNRIVATFFFSASSDKSATVLPPTLARQLAHNVPDTKPHIIDSLKANPSPFQYGIGDQLKRLIIEPLAACKTLPSKLVILIDGADECADENGLTDFLSSLERSADARILPIRFIICSRPEPRIRAILMKKDEDRQGVYRPPENAPGAHAPPTSPTVNSSTTFPSWKKIMLFVRNSNLASITPYLARFKSSGWKLKRLGQLYPAIKDAYWPSEEKHQRIRVLKTSDTMDRIIPHTVVSRIQIGESEGAAKDIKAYLTMYFEAYDPPVVSAAIDVLVGNACGQFLYASTIVRLLKEDWKRDEIVALVQAPRTPLPNDALKALFHLDRLYAGILLKATEAARKTEAEILKDTFAILVVFEENTQLAMIQENFLIIEDLLGWEKKILRRSLTKLHSVLIIKPESTIDVYHRSFLEFLQDPDRSQEFSVAYQTALRRFLLIFRNAIVRFAFKGLCRNMR